MPARDPFSENDLPRVYATLATCSLRDQALLTLGLLIGFRARELGAMTIGHVLAEDGSVRSSLALERRHLKHGRGAYRAKVRARTVPLAPNARAALERYIAERRGEGTAELEAPLFRSRKGFGLSPWQINRIVHRLAEAAGCDANRFYGSHSLRKSFAHAVHRACGRDITVTRVALGHHSVLVTQRYIRVEQAEVDAAILAVGSGMAAAGSLGGAAPRRSAAGPRFFCGAGSIRNPPAIWTRFATPPRVQGRGCMRASPARKNFHADHHLALRLRGRLRLVSFQPLRSGWNHLSRRNRSRAPCRCGRF